MTTRSWSKVGLRAGASFVPALTLNWNLAVISYSFSSTKSAWHSLLLWVEKKSPVSSRLHCCVQKFLSSVFSPDPRGFPRLVYFIRSDSPKTPLQSLSSLSSAYPLTRGSTLLPTSWTFPSALPPFLASSWLSSLNHSPCPIVCLKELSEPATLLLQLPHAPSSCPAATFTFVSCSSQGC